MNKLLILIASLLLLSGCSTFIKQNPTLNDISGEWVATGPMPFVKLVIAENTPNYMAIVYNEKEIEIYEFKSFKSLKSGFECEIVNISKKENGNSNKMKGSVILNRIVLSPENEETTKIWFTKASDLKKYQGIADIELKKHNNANQH